MSLLGPRRRYWAGWSAPDEVVRASYDTLWSTVEAEF